ATLALDLVWVVLVFLSPGVGAQTGQSFKLHQPQDEVLVTAGDTLTLTCTVSVDSLLGPVKWLKGWGSSNETVYEQTGTFPRVTRVVSASDADFSIRISDVRPEDAGTYYCVKFSKSLGGEEVFRHGKGTEVSVHALPTPPVVSGPNHRAGPGQSVSFTCTAGGFFPRDISVKWFKDNTTISAQQPQITPGRTRSSYNVSSNVTMTLQEDDVRARLVCEVQHSTLPAPLRGHYQLSRALRVSPHVRVVPDLLSPVGVNKTLNFTCHVEGFYPGEVAVTWLENGTEIKVENVSQLRKNPRGLFGLRSLVEVQATEERNGSVFTCRVVHDALPISPPVPLPPAVIPHPNVWLLVRLSKRVGAGSPACGDGAGPVRTRPAGCCCEDLVLHLNVPGCSIAGEEATVHSVISGVPPFRLHEPEKSSEATTQVCHSAPRAGGGSGGCWFLQETSPCLRWRVVAPP
uniref:Ig-like domain-containing protein n=1 Tax=Athene cunicularia TaxID=194338 RepID=A0A663MU22_ATHCN